MAAPGVLDEVGELPLALQPKAAARPAGTARARKRRTARRRQRDVETPSNSTTARFSRYRILPR
jgi:hypothetical protein